MMSQKVLFQNPLRVISVSRGVRVFKKSGILRKVCFKSHFQEHNRSFINRCLVTSNRLRCSHNGKIQLNEQFSHKIDKQLQDALAFYGKGWSFNSLESSDLVIAMRKFNILGLKKTTLDDFNVKLSGDQNSLLFPLSGLQNKETIAIQFLTCNCSQENKEFQESSFPRTSEAALFGLSHVGESRKKIVVTSSPLDAIVVTQETGVAAIALPHDIAALPREIFPLLKDFQKVTFWLSDENPDWRTLIGMKLGDKSYFVCCNEDTPSPLLSLQKGLNIRSILRNTSPIIHRHLSTLSAFSGILKRSREKSLGTKWKRFTPLNEILKGHRRGELTVFSGQTGTGKTTFMSEYSIDLAMQGVRTLWASFEISTERLIEMMLMQFSLSPLEELYKNPDFWESELEKLNFQFLMLHGQHSIKTVIDAMVHAVKVNGVQHAIIDNLQFMTSADDVSFSIDLYRLQDQIYSEFRRFATLHNCHVTLVIHPRKEPEYTPLNNSSISGTAKATQEADNILILQSTKSQQYIQVTKNRFDGTRGHFFIDFDRSTKSFSVKFSKNNPIPTTIPSS